VIKIRYRDPNELSPGLHAAAERHGRNTTVYLLSGLTAVQRRAALRRLRISGRRGYDPKLPAPQLAVALLADRVRTTAGRAGAVFRSHPAGSTVPVMVISAGAIAFLALSAVSIHVIRHPANPGPPPSAEAAGLPGAGAGAGAGGSAGAGSRPGGSAGPNDAGVADPGQAGSAAGNPGQNGSGLSQGDNGHGNGTGHGTGAGNGTGNGNGTGSGTDPSSGTGSNTGTGTTLSGTSAPNPVPAGDPTTATAAAPATSAAAAPAATTSKPSAAPSASKSGLCVNVGPLGVCL
jgi:hypothetical protein